MINVLRPCWIKVLLLSEKNLTNSKVWLVVWFPYLHMPFHSFKLLDYFSKILIVKKLLGVSKHFNWYSIPRITLNIILTFSFTLSQSPELQMTRVLEKHQAWLPRTGHQSPLQCNRAQKVPPINNQLQTCCLCESHNFTILTCGKWIVLKAEATDLTSILSSKGFTTSCASIPEKTTRF